MEPYYANESTVGRVRSGEVPFAIEVFEAPGNSMPSGIAVEVGSTVFGLALWRLKVHGERVPGRFIIEDGQFVLVESARGDAPETGGTRKEMMPAVAKMR
jgi:membrane-associated phospholipid phosphatase